MKKVGALFGKTSKSGTKYLQVVFTKQGSEYQEASPAEIVAAIESGHGFMAFRNQKYVPGGKMPVYNMVLVEDNRQKQDAAPQQQQLPSAPIGDDDIPF